MWRKHEGAGAQWLSRKLIRLVMKRLLEEETHLHRKKINLLSDNLDSYCTLDCQMKIF